MRYVCVILEERFSLLYANGLHQRELEEVMTAALKPLGLVYRCHGLTTVEPKGLVHITAATDNNHWNIPHSWPAGVKSIVLREVYPERSISHVERIKRQFISDTEYKSL